MEGLLKFLPRRPQPPILRFGVATVLALLSLGFMVALQQAGGPYGLYLLYPPIFACALAFDRATGLYVAALEVAGVYLLLRIPGSLALPNGYLLALLIFLIIAALLALLCEGLRTAWERAAAAERSKDLLLRELGHRTKNNLMMVTSILSFQARLKTNPEVRSALEKALLRIHAITAAHEHLQRGEIEGGTNMQAYLETLCNQLVESLRDVRPIAIDAEVCDIELPTKDAVALGLITNELVANALKHAFPDDRAGAIRVRLEDSPLTLTVEDDGVGCQAKPGGIGSRLVRLLVEQLKGTVEWQPLEQGCRAIVQVSGLPQNA